MLRSIILTLLPLCWIGTLSQSASAAHLLARAPEGAAPSAGMLPSDGWSSGIKQAFGTAYEAYDSSQQFSAQSPTAPISRVWFTAAQGVLTEVFWPTIDTPQLRDSQFLITTAEGGFIEERQGTESKAEWIQAGVPAFRITNRDRQNRFTIEKTLFADPDRDAVIMRVRIQRNVPGLGFYILHNPSVANSPFGDNGKVSTGAAPGPGLFAWQGDQAQALVSSVAFSEATAGFGGASSDGWKVLQAKGKLEANYETASGGNVVLTGHLDLPSTTGSSDFDLVLGFGSNVNAAYSVAQAALTQDIGAALQKFSSQWAGYQSRLKNLSSVSGDGGTLFRASAAVIKSTEDKTFAGAFIASPTVPWGSTRVNDSSSRGPGEPRGSNATGGYHLVWPRDLYQMATAFLALDDANSAIASLNYLKKIQFDSGDGEYSFDGRHLSKDGAFPQNCWVNGETYWGGLQMDEVAMPIILAYRLWQRNLIEPSRYWDMVRRAADFLKDFGPWTRQERWEESFGASPSTIAAEISGLWTAAEIADEMGDSERARTYRATADSWSSKPGDNLDTWTFTTSGSKGNGRYFTRIEGAHSYGQTWDPNDNQSYEIANQGGIAREKDELDGGFLELVRFGVRAATNANIQDTLPEYDQVIRTQVPGHGPGFIRYNGDHYSYNEANGAQTAAMPWPLLTGERAHYEIALAAEQGRSTNAASDPYLRALESFATPSKMIPEQVWKDGPDAGGPTGAATPLGWAHGEYLKLLRSRLDGSVFDQLQIAKDRSKMLRSLTPDERFRILR